MARRQLHEDFSEPALGRGVEAASRNLASRLAPTAGIKVSMITRSRRASAASSRVQRTGFVRHDLGLPRPRAEVAALPLLSRCVVPVAPARTIGDDSSSAQTMLAHSAGGRRVRLFGHPCNKSCRRCPRSTGARVLATSSDQASFADIGLLVGTPRYQVVAPRRGLPWR